MVYVLQLISVLTIIPAEFLFLLRGPKAQGLSNRFAQFSTCFKSSLLVLANSLNISNINLIFFVFSVTISLVVSIESMFVGCSQWHGSIM